ncbi:hypothetical protein ACFPM0_27145 [Pseudonocardia sulfidoxydans]|uniref:hypothetical protein n=1 Tax=Pseudonocardia sulfidoxydans TaxID=54011 RepID=UPI00360DFC4E
MGTSPTAPPRLGNGVRLGRRGRLNGPVPTGGRHRTGRRAPRGGPPRPPVPPTEPGGRRAPGRG